MCGRRCEEVGRCGRAVEAGGDGAEDRAEMWGNRRLYYSGLGKCSDAEARCRVHHFSSPDIERPYLISGKKLDLRVLAVVRSLEPLQIYLLQEDPFYARCANKEYGLGRFDDFERHFTTSCPLVIILSLFPRSYILHPQISSLLP
ncbi:LOW QUALITY PROTEIN: hypothetical protein BC936DRAFT_149229 [Jimgerdemannia flammicorona]|uniref:Uncharacterized protein n=1 Tax=Jimgerdemannia flammicorona TaxID=994334 RepID=A0A433D191_9FUNG|nr:LOW QUALITY PROTEIN: hypothetical protein BC936DRAFT_149229 [Jimgerdemannia flammicorona]